MLRSLLGLPFWFALVVGCGGALEPSKDKDIDAPPPSEPVEDSAKAPSTTKSTPAQEICESGEVEFRRDFCCPHGASCSQISWPGNEDPPCEIDCNRVCGGVAIKGTKAVVESCEWVPFTFTLRYRCGWCGN